MKGQPTHAARARRALLGAKSGSSVTVSQRVSSDLRLDHHLHGVFMDGTRLRFRLADVCYTFRVGHRIMVHVQSSWFPLIDRNPQVFMDTGKAKDEDLRSATEKICREAKRPSRIVPPVLP